MTTIPDIIDEQAAARLLDNAGEIIERATADTDPAISVHLDAYAMAAELNDHLRAALEAMPPHQQGRPSAEATLTFVDWTDQLAAHHLDFLDRLNHV